jgi:hypothetical protein
MKTKLFTRISGMTLVGVLTLAGGTVLSVGPAKQDKGGGTLEGAWLNEVQIVTCPPAPFAVIATVQSMTTYMRGGILIEGGGPPAPPPAVSRSAGHGIWERTGGHTFLVFFRSHSFDNLGRRVRISEVTSHPSLIQGDNPDTPDLVEPYYLSGDGTNKITNLNPVDGTVISVTEGCNKATSTPLLFWD